MRVIREIFRCSEDSIEARETCRKGGICEDGGLYTAEVQYRLSMCDWEVLHPTKDDEDW
jgi:hypothetical protein